MTTFSMDEPSRFFRGGQRVSWSDWERLKQLEISVQNGRIILENLRQTVPLNLQMLQWTQIRLTQEAQELKALKLRILNGCFSISG